MPCLTSVAIPMVVASQIKIVWELKSVWQVFDYIQLVFELVQFISTSMFFSSSIETPSGCVYNGVSYKEGLFDFWKHLFALFLDVKLSLNLTLCCNWKRWYSDFSVSFTVSAPKKYVFIHHGDVIFFFYSISSILLFTIFSLLDYNVQCNLFVLILREAKTFLNLPQLSFVFTQVTKCLPVCDVNGVFVRMENDSVRPSDVIIRTEASFADSAPYRSVGFHRNV